MRIHEIQLPYRKKDRKRIGRGGKRGTTSGRGTKGQRSRSGHRIRPAVRDLILRLPKHRGFRNKTVSQKPVVLDFSRVMEKIKPLLGKSGPFPLERGVLEQMNLVSPRHRGGVKILGKGEASVPLAVKGIKVSAGVKSAIEKAGGTVQ